MSFPELVEVEPARAGVDGKPAVGPVYRVAYAKDGAPAMDHGITTLLELFEFSVKRYPDRPCLGRRRAPAEAGGAPGPYEFMTYKEVSDNVAQVHGALVQLGIQPKDRMGVIGPNTPEWMIVMQACNRMNLTCVPLYDTLGDNAVEYIVKHSEAKVLVAAGEKLQVVAKSLAIGELSKQVTAVAYWGHAPEAAVKAVTDLGVKVLSWSELLELGSAQPTPEHVAPTPEDLCTIMYTSGTTGDPKGVMITHKAVVYMISSVQAFLAHFNEVIGPDDVYLSYLTLAHIFDRVVEEFMLHVGGSIGYWRGDVRKLIEDVDALRPTLFCGVPRVFERIHNGVQEQLSKAGFLKGAIFNWAFSRKLWYMNGGWKHDQASPLADSLVFDKIKQRLGGRVRVIVSGGAPIPGHVEEFLKVAMCAPAVQGYGLTETCAASFISYPYTMDQTGTCGPPMPCNELRLEAVEDMGYSPTGSPPRGEVCLRGPNVFVGYYKNEAMTAEVLDADGFFHTGDIGEITPSGALKIIDRKKNMFKLSQGEYVAVEKLENVYKACTLVEQIWVYGNSFESFLVAVVVPKEARILELAQQKGLEGSFKELLSQPAIQSHVLHELKATGKAGKLKGFEDIKAVHLESEHFSVDNDLMTQSFKLKRAPLLKRYREEIDGMYERVKRATPSGGH